ncbi:MAG: DUF3048 domain-containing protein [Actinomycetia bacterium]|nr:DUF3048 domain-containing protein [Actinomycetes bacterium]
MISARSRLLGAACLATALLVSACATESPGSLDSASSELPLPPQATWAMTGLPDPEGKADAPVLTVKIDNTSAARPQSGVERADLVVQEPVEGGATRLAAFYQSTSPKRVGPVRSVRTSDVGLVLPVRATLVASGGAQVVLRTMAAANVTVVDESNPNLTRDTSRPAPYNVYASLAGLQSEGIGKPPKQPYLDFGAITAPDGGKARSVSVRSSSLATEDWSFDKKAQTWNRESGNFAANNLIMLQVELADAGYQDPAGNPVPEVVTSGKGKGWLATGGNVRKIRWSKSALDASFALTTRDGAPIQVPPGKSWISLLPQDTSQVSYR